MNSKICKSCQVSKLVSDFYRQTDRENGASWCKNCFNAYCVKRWVETKIKAIEYKGSECEHCSISYPTVPYSVFDFHHTNPLEKDVDWTKLRKRSWKKIKFELNKCQLLCSNCHRIYHHENR